MNELYIYENMLKLIRERIQLIEEATLYGGVSDFTAFQVLRGQLSTLAQLEQDLKNLLDKVTDE